MTKNINELVDRSIRVSVNQYPQIIPLLKGSAAWIGKSYAWKLGEAPDDNQRRKDERKLERVIVEYFRDQLKRVVKEIKADNKSQKNILQLSFWENELQLLWNKASGVFIDIVLHGIDGAINLLPLSAQALINQGRIQNRVIRLGLEYKDQWVKTINETTMKRVWNAVETWKQSGEPLDNLIKLLEEKPFMFDKARAKRIAVTETTRLHALGNELTFKEAGYIKQWNWMTAQDELVCDTCRLGHEGGPYPIDELHNKLPAHVNCRCWSQPIVDEDALNETIDLTLEEGEYL